MKIYKLLLWNLVCGAVVAGGITINSIPKEQSQVTHVGTDEGGGGDEDSVELDPAPVLKKPKPMSLSELESLGDNQKTIQDQATKIQDAKMMAKFDRIRVKRLEAQRTTAESKLKLTENDLKRREEQLKWSMDNLRRAKTFVDPANPRVKFRPTAPPPYKAPLAKTPVPKQSGTYKEAPF